MISNTLSKIPLDRLPTEALLNDKVWEGVVFDGWTDLNVLIEQKLELNQNSVFIEGQSHQLELVLISGSYHLSLASLNGEGRSHLHVKIKIKAGESVSLLLTSPPASSVVWSIFEGNIIVEPSAKLNLIFVGDNGSTTPLTSNLVLNVMEQAEFHAFYAFFDGQLHYQELVVNLSEQSLAHIDALILTNKKHYSGFQPIIHHRGVETVSKITVRSIVQGPSTTFVHGRIVVHPGANKTQANYKNNNLILGQGAMVIAQPELDIQFDDVVCAHGVTTGTLDEQALFYLQSRGIPLEQGKILLIHSFAQELLNRAPKLMLMDLMNLFDQKLKKLLEENNAA